MRTFKYDPLDLEGPAFRLIRLFKASWGEIRCELFDAWLDSDVLIPYEALSYVWGGLDRKHEIQVNGYAFGVTSNLYSALQHLRTNQERILWTDAICIDQDNTKERGHQVRHMAEIYKLADRVVIWLGPSTNELVVVMLAMEQLQKESAKYACRDWKVTDKRWMDIWTVAQRTLERETLSTQHLEQSLISLLSLSWFKRVWILQEIAYARRAVFVCGHKSASARFLPITTALLGVEPNHQQQAVLDIIPGSRNACWWSEKRNLYTLLAKFRDCEASDRRDKIYALLRMSTDAWPRLGIDYGKSGRTVVRDTISFLFSADQNGLGPLPLPDWDVDKFFQKLDSLTNEIFVLAVSTGNLVVAEQLIRQGDVDVNFTDENGFTPLLRAAGCRFEIMARQLLDHGANIDTRDRHGCTALSRAVVNVDVTLVQLLVQRGANVHIKNGDGQSPLAATLSALVSGQLTRIPQSEPGHEAFGPDLYFQIVRLLFENGAYSDENRAETQALLREAAGKYKQIAQMVDSFSFIY